MKALIGAMALFVAVPATAQTAARTVPASTATVDAERLALARKTVDGLWPSGTYARMMDRMMGGMVDDVMGSMLDMKPADIAAMIDEPDADVPTRPAKPRKPMPDTSLREEIRKSDPHFEERMRITSRVMGEEMGRIGALIEPKMRDGLAVAVATRFSAPQLAEINGFFATDSGQALASELMMLWTDPAVLKSIMGSLPEVMKAMPAAFKRVEAATAHLPRPTKRSAETERKKK